MQIAAVYRPRHPECTDLYQVIEDHLDNFLTDYDELYLNDYGPLTHRRQRTLEGYLKCGRLVYGFARVRCATCSHEMLIAFSCQLRGICPSCQQKRAELLCRFMADEVIEPTSHRQLVFVLPKNLRRPFNDDPTLLTSLCQIVAQVTQQFYLA